MTRSDVVDIEVHVHHRTEKAILVSQNGDKDEAVWVPLSQVEIEKHQTLQRAYILTIPEWLAADKGML